MTTYPDVTGRRGDDRESTAAGSTGPDAIRAAIERFHAILAHDRVASSTHDLLARRQHDAGLRVEGRPYSSTLRPRLIAGTDHARICTTAALLTGAVHRLAAHALADDEMGRRVRSILAPAPLEMAVAAMAPATDGAPDHGRLDGFLDGERIAFVEYNAHPPGGVLTQDIIAEIYADTPAMRAFTREFPTHSTATGPRVADTLLHAWETGGAPGGHPSVAIVECGTSVAGWEFHHLREHLANQGIDALVCSTDDLTYTPGQGLRARDDNGSHRPVTVVYRRAVLTDLIARHGNSLPEHPMMRGWADGACVMVNSPSSHLAHKKSALALLTDPTTRHLLSPRERTAARAHVPWTRLLRPGSTTHGDREIDLLDFAQCRRDQLILKPNDSYGGHGILRGRHRTERQWRDDLRRALTVPHVLQERVSIPRIPYPRWHEGRLLVDDWYEGTDPYLFGTTAHGCISRLGHDDIINVSTGGTGVPVFQLTTARGQERSRPTGRSGGSLEPDGRAPAPHPVRPTTSS
ncbi:hypothetical protein ACIOJD_24330 [Streptomyces sp. NPDC088116]|uniref:hypothetical protein n=1 Tax=Streptomyces sp. NPDC088116 TaxID=3365825 RepID=UPI00382D6E90